MASFRVNTFIILYSQAVVIRELIAAQFAPLFVGESQKVDQRNRPVVMREVIGKINVMERNSFRGEEAIGRLQNA